MPRVSHFEFTAEDPSRASTFYTDVFGWNFIEFGESDEDYWYIVTGPNDTPGINGGMMRRREGSPNASLIIDIQDIDAAAAKIEQSGGKIVVPKMEIPTVGWVAFFTDPEGNIVGIHQPAEGNNSSENS